MIYYLIFQKKLSFLQQPFPDIKLGIILPFKGINKLVKIPDPFCSFILLYFNCFLICIGKFFKILFILFISLCFKLILIEPPLFFLFI